MTTIMNVSLGNIYPIPEIVTEEEPNDNHCETSFSASEKVVKKTSSTSLPEKQSHVHKSGLKRKENSIPSLTAKENDRNVETVLGTHKYCNRQATSLIDFTNFSLTENEEPIKTDKQNATSPRTISEKISKSYLNIKDCTSYSNDEPEYEILLSPRVIPNVNPPDQNPNTSNQTSCQTKQRKGSDNLVFIDLNSEEDGYYHTLECPTVPNTSRQRSGSLQWIQNAFQNVSSKYKGILDFRRPSDIAEERIRNSKEGLDMEESESEMTTDANKNPSAGNRRFSENIIGKQKRFPFVGRLGHLKDLWKDRHSGGKKQEEKENDQTRTDVCPLFVFPRKQNEDELILDTLRQAMRKCTAVDPDSRPSSTTVFENLSNLLKEC